MSAIPLPIFEVLPQLRESVADNTVVRLSAPPGAGKTTVVPTSFVQEPWLDGTKILMIEPRRIAAKAAAARMAHNLNEAVGQTVGFRIRGETNCGANTVVEVVTAGVLLRLLQADPALSAYGLVIFDEFHERQLAMDLGLSLALQSQNIFGDDRPPLRLIIMSATLDDNLRSILPDAPLVECHSHVYDIETHYRAPPKPRGTTSADNKLDRDLPHRIVQSILWLDQQFGSQQTTGHCLVFLPGRGHIERTREALLAHNKEWNDRIIILHGSLSVTEQQRALAPQAERAIVLATNVAESSVTIANTIAVIDSGLEFQSQFDPHSGATQLELTRISSQSATQRAGRAGRTRDGLCIRLWSEGEQSTLLPRTTPEIVRSDLREFWLQCLSFGVNEINDLALIDCPSITSITHAQQYLRQIGAIDHAGQITNHGVQLLTTGTSIPIATMLVRAQEEQTDYAAATVAAILDERDPLAEFGVDLADRVSMVDGTTAVRKRNTRWLHAVRKRRDQYRGKSTPSSQTDAITVAKLLSYAFPDWVAKRHKDSRTDYQLANGRVAQLSDHDRLAGNDWLVVGRIGQLKRKSIATIQGAIGVDFSTIKQWTHLQDTKPMIRWDTTTGGFIAEQQTFIGAHILEQKPLSGDSTETRIRSLCDHIKSEQLAPLQLSPAVRRLQTRASFAQTSDGDIAAISDMALIDAIDEWCAPMLATVTNLRQLPKIDWLQAIQNYLGYRMLQTVNRLCPTHYTAPTGTRCIIDYGSEQPTIHVRLQEMLGLTKHPMVGNLPLRIELLSPARRPIQVTQDIVGFWQSSYQLVRKDMRGRYPKHAWPEDPQSAIPTRHTKKRAQKSP